jgi:hypothetical protein
MFVENIYPVINEPLLIKNRYNNFTFARAQAIEHLRELIKRLTLEKFRASV